MMSIEKPVKDGNVVRRLSFLALAVWIGMGSATGSDASPGVPGPIFAVESNHPGNVHSATVKVDGNAITVGINVDVGAGMPRNASVAMPVFKWRGEADPYPDRHYPELEIQVDGKPAVLRDGFEAVVDNVDISRQLRDAALDPYAIADSPPIVEPVPGKQSEFDVLEKTGAIARDDGLYLARWSVRRIIQIELPQGPSFVTMNYTSRPAYSLQSIAELNKREFLSKYCLSSKGLWKTLGAKSRDAHVVAEEHAVEVGHAAMIPLRVTIETGSFSKSQAVVSFCPADGKGVSLRKMRTTQARTSESGVFRWLVVKPAQ